MKRIITLLLSCILLFSTASASSLFPSLEPQPEETTEKAPSYGVWADVQPNYVDPNSEVETSVQVYTGIAFMYAVSQENYFAYGNYLGEQGYELSDSYQYSNSAYSLLQALHLTKADITYYIIYVPETERLIEIYPYGVEYERIDPLKDYIEVQKNASFKLGGNAKLTVKSMDYYSYVLDVNPSITLNVQNLTNKMLFTDDLCNINLHVFAGNNHFTFKVREYGEIWRTRQGRYALKGASYWKSMESGECTFAFDTTQADILNLEPDKMAITFEYGSYKYVYYVK